MRHEYCINTCDIDIPSTDSEDEAHCDVEIIKSQRDDVR